MYIPQSPDTLALWKNLQWLPHHGKSVFFLEAKLYVKWRDKRIIANFSPHSLVSTLAHDATLSAVKCHGECAVKPLELTTHTNYRFHWGIRLTLTWEGKA